MDYLIITCCDRGHVGGVRVIGSAIAIDMVYLSAYEGIDKNYRSPMSAIEDLGLAIHRVETVLSLQLGGAH